MMMPLPDAPPPVAVSLPAARSGVVVLDLSDYACARTPQAAATLPTVRVFLDRARLDGVRVLFSIGRVPQSVHPELARRDGEPVVQSSADKFFRTDLERLLEGRTHIVVLGTAANGAVLYTSFAACARGFTVVVAVDGISSRTELATAVATWQLLNQPGFVNSENAPLADELVTLSRTDLIRFVR